jgi:hypothetical protein
VKTFKDRVTLNKNSRGCYIIDTVKGCRGCNGDRPRGCYGDCYAWNISARYGRDFSKIVNRDFPKDTEQFRLFDFDDTRHTADILRAIEKAEMPFIRIGELGDPSQDWKHTVAVCKIIKGAGKNIVIITKHWESIPDELLGDIEGVFINTSISALDDEEEVEHRINQYTRLAKHCNSILRIVSCDFNLENHEGFIRAQVQDGLFALGKSIDTVFRPSANNPLVVNGIIKTKKIKFLGTTMIASVYKKSAFLGYCKDCPDMCGLSLV